MLKFSQFHLIVVIIGFVSVSYGASLNDDVTLRANEAKNEDKLDIFLGWMNNPALEPFKPFFSQIQSTVGPMSQQASAQILDNIPGSKEIFKQISKMQEQLGSMVSQFNPAQQLMGGQKDN